METIFHNCDCKQKYKQRNKQTKQNMKKKMPYALDVHLERIKVTAKRLYSAFEILVVRAPGTTKKVAGQPIILMWLSDGQP